MNKMVAAKMIVASMVIMIGPDRFVNISKLCPSFSILFVGNLHFILFLIHSALEGCELESYAMERNAGRNLRKGDFRMIQ